MLRVRRMSEDYNSAIKIAIIDERGDKRFVAKPIKFVDVTNSVIEEPTLRFDFFHYDRQEFATFFLDWIELAKEMNITLNPEFNQEKKAILNHLEDMRKLVFKNK